MLFVLPIRGEIKTSVLNRVLAKLVDLSVVIAFVSLLAYPLGPLLGFLYSIFADGLPINGLRGQSLGKKILKLRVVQVGQKTPASIRESALRNAPVGVATFFAFITVWGWLLLLLIGVPLMIMEIYLMLSVDSGHRLGDVMGDTEVVEL